MAQKNEIPALVLALVTTAALIGGGFWWLTQKAGISPGRLFTSTGPETPTNPDTVPAADRTGLAQVPNVPTGLFNYGGSTTWAPIRGRVEPVIATTFPKFKLRYTDPMNGAPGSGSGIRMLLDGQLAFSQSSRSLEDQEYQQAQQRGFGLKQIPVALEGIAIAVHPELPVTGLTLDQLQAVYTGKVKNWNQLGGPDLAIIPYSRRLQDGGTVEFFVSNILNKQPFGRNVQYVYSTTDALRQVSRNPGGIYFASAPEVVPQCGVKPLPLARQANTFVPPYREPLIAPDVCPNQRNQINLEALKSGKYPITRQLFVIVKQNGQLEQQAGEAYANLLLTEQGQDLVEQAGFVRLR
jgi:phosphate transport system substrate-binding protein